LKYSFLTQKQFMQNSFVISSRYITIGDIFKKH
jgi:hypothetical protein